MNRPRKPTFRRNKRGRGGYSIAALLLLIATVAVLLALGRSLLATRDDETWELAGINMAAGFLGGNLVGAMIGFSYENRGRGLLVGAIVGGLTGIAAGACAAAAISVPVAIGGSLLLIAVGALVRATSAQTAPQTSTTLKPPSTPFKPPVEPPVE